MQTGGAGHRGVNAAGLQAAVAKDLPGSHPRENALDVRSVQTSANVHAAGRVTAADVFGAAGGGHLFSRIAGPSWDPGAF